MRNISFKYTIVIVLFLFGLKGFSQSQKTYFIPDSLKNKTYDDFYTLFNVTLDKGDYKESEFYSKIGLHKAKNEKDTIQIAIAYVRMHILSDSEIIALKYADSIINLTKNINHKGFPSNGYIIKGKMNYHLSKYDESLKNMLIAQEYAIKNNNQNHLSIINSGIGKIKMYWGNYNEAISHFKSRLNYLTNNSKELSNRYNYLLTLSNLSHCHIQLKQLDSALIYNRIGYEKSIELEDKHNWDLKFIKQSGFILFYENKYKAALDSINKGAIADIGSTSERPTRNLLNTAYYKGKIYNKLNDSLKTFEYFKKVDSIYNSNPNVVVPEIREVQGFFVKHYAKQKDVDNQLIYVNRLLHVDSIVDSNRKELNETIIKKYDRPKLLAEKQSIINSLQRKKTKSRILIACLIAGLIIFVGFSIRFYYLQSVYKKRFKDLVNNNETEEITIKPTEPLQGISQDIVNTILKQLEQLEKDYLFLDQNITLGSLAKTYNTNSSYLSKIINHYKQKSFSAYLTGLRIEYAINKLKIDKVLRSYTIKAIANDMGFKNSESFSKAFYKKAGIYPSFFIKQIEKQDKVA